MKKKIAVVLCGSGYLDGSEIRESVAVLWALSKHPVEVSIFAPNENQFHVMDCLHKKPVAGEVRNQMVEAARIARGQISPLSELNMDRFNGLILPGGFGAAKNLCTFAFDGVKGKVHPVLERSIEIAHHSKKPIGAVCIAPVIVALALRNAGLKLTLGGAGEAATAVEALGHEHVVCAVNQAVVDSKNRVVSTPAYMIEDAYLFEIFEGIESLVREVVALA